MRVLGRLLIGVTMGLSTGFLLSVSPAVHAQDGGAVRCESQNGRFNRCQVQWRDAVLMRQESRGACVRGQSWGLDRYGLWVDRGCRGVFAAATRGWGGDDGRPGYGNGYGYGNNYGYGRPDRGDDDWRGGWRGEGRDDGRSGAWGRQVAVQCDSHGGDYRFCPVDGGVGGRVQLLHRDSDASCNEGRGWGWNDAGVWVDRGCRGKFLVDRRW